MMRYFLLFLNILFISSALFLFSCSEDSATNAGDDYDFSTILADFAEKTVIATYQDLNSKANDLLTAAENFKNDPTQSNLDATANAWKETRVPWEASEAFLFGPAANLSLDPSMDSWPLDQTQLSEVLASNFELTPEFISDGLGFALRGFHTIEYLIFGDGQPRVAGNITDREKEYLVAVVEVLVNDTEILYESWNTGLDGARAYKNEFINAGTAGSRYVSQRAAVQEIVEGMIGITDEVGNGKIAGPFGSKNVLEVESWFSWNSLTDFENNINSIENAYTGGYHLATKGIGIDTYVNQKDASLDLRIKTEIAAARNAIRAIPAPFRNSLNNTSQVQAAIDACNTLVQTFEADLKPLLAQ